LKVKGSFVMVGELRDFCHDIKHIIPGINLVNRLMLTSSAGSSQAVMQQKVKDINTFARSAQSEVSVIANKRREDVRD
jgi:hypothetical protein